MTTHIMPAGAATSFRRDASRRSSTDPATLIAAALFIAVLIAEAAFIALAAPSVADIGSLYALVP